MSGETESQQSGWTVDTLHAHFDMLFRLLREQLERQWQSERRATDLALGAHDEALRVARETSEKAITAALDAQKEAVSVQAETLRQYDDKQNEWRGSLNDLGRLAMPRSEAEAAIQRAVEAITEIRLGQQQYVTRTELDAALRAADASHRADRERVTELTKQITQMSAAAAGAADKVKGIYPLLGAGISIIIAAIALFNFLASR